MIHSVKMLGYRAFAKFEMGSLGRVNLLVGKNNTGKTSILEGLYILASGSNPATLWQVLARRGEQVVPDPTPNRAAQAEIDVSHLFYGHDISAGTRLSISTTNEKPGRSVEYRIDMAKPEENPHLFAQLADEGPSAPRLALWATGKPDFAIPPLPLSKLGSIRAEILQQYLNLRAPRVETGTTQFVTTESLAIGQILQLWSTIVLTTDEDRVIRALRILEQGIERIAQVQIGPVSYLGMGYSFPTRGGFFVRLANNEKRIPIGSFGDGIWRMLALAVALVRAKDSLLLVDEIDTGLHYTVMADMWKLINEAAELFNVQVFATTHSYDCVYSLARICHEVEDANSQITIQRIEAGKERAVPFTEAEILIAADRNIEIR
jgi:AAA domain, putative AbiEii toxin, Type IV TA system/AAA ATPase domain